MNKIKLVIISAVLFLLVVYVVKVPEPVPPIKPFPPPIVESIPQEPPELKILPQFDVWVKVRNNNDLSLGKVLQDIDNHMPAGHDYIASNKMTWAHETTHGINANIRNHHKDASQVNGFYCLWDRSVVLYEPKVKITEVAAKIPVVLRGPSYNLYLVQQAHSWNDRPLYLFDEWVAYTNGSECGKELNISNWDYELLQAHNFNVYCMYLAMLAKSDDKQFKSFMMWNIERTFSLLGNQNDVLSYIDKVRHSPEAEDLRVFARSYFGAAWCKKVYGF